MTTKTVNLYSFDELTDSAKEKAREWWRECESQHFGAHGDLYESYETAAKILGITFKTHPVKLMGGSTRYEPNIYWQLHVQGSGAAFEGSYEYAKGSSKGIRAEFGTDKELHRIARELTSLQKQYFYKLAGVITTDSRFVHNGAMDIELANYGEGVKEDDYKALLQLMRDFADWIYDGINTEYEYCMSDENVDDAIRANEYTFTAKGKRED